MNAPVNIPFVKYTKEEFLKAYEMVLSGASIYQTAKHFGFDRRTLSLAIVKYLDHGDQIFFKKPKIIYIKKKRNPSLETENPKGFVAAYSDFKAGMHLTKAARKYGFKRARFKYAVNKVEESGEGWRLIEYSYRSDLWSMALYSPISEAGKRSYEQIQQRELKRNLNK